MGLLKMLNTNVGELHAEEVKKAKQRFSSRMQAQQGASDRMKAAWAGVAEQLDAAKANVAADLPPAPQIAAQQPTPTHMAPTPAASFVGLLATVALVWWMWPNLAFLLNPMGAVADDVEEQYHIAKESGALADTCLAAGTVAQSWLMAKDAAQYRKWRAIEKTDCNAAGLGMLVQ